MEDENILRISELLKTDDSDFWELTNNDIAKIMQSHGFRTEEKDSKIYGYIPFINVNTKETGEEETDLTGYDIDEIKEYLGY